MQYNAKFDTGRFDQSNFNLIATTIDSQSRVALNSSLTKTSQCRVSVLSVQTIVSQSIVKYNYSSILSSQSRIQKSASFTINSFSRVNVLNIKELTSISNVKYISSLTKTSLIKTSPWIGYWIDGPSNDSFNLNETYASMYITPNDNAGSSIMMGWYGNVSSNGSLYLGIYDVSNGSPNTLLGSVLTTITSGTNPQWWIGSPINLALPIGSYFLAWSISGV